MVILPHRRKAFRDSDSSLPPAGIPQTDLLWSIDADVGVLTTGGGAATDGQVVETWEDQTGSSDLSYVTGTQAIYHATGGPNNKAYVEFPATSGGGQYDWTDVTCKTAVAIYELANNTINWPLQDSSFDIGSYANFWGEYRSSMSNLVQVYDRGGGGFWWWGDRPGAPGAKLTWYTFAPTATWVIVAMRTNAGGTTDFVIDSTRDRRSFGMFQGGIRKAVAYSSILSNADLETIFDLWSTESNISLRSATVLDRSEY